MKKVAVILSGCGVFDGAEIHEAVISLLALARQGKHPFNASPPMSSASCHQSPDRRGQ